MLILKLGVMKKYNTQKEDSFKKVLEALCGQEVSDQEAFDAQYNLAELLQTLDEIEQTLSTTKLQAQHIEGVLPQGGEQ